MKKIIIILIVLILVGGMVFWFFKQKESKPKPEYMPMEKIENKKIAMIIAFNNFRDEEYFVPRQIFDKAGIEVKVVSNKIGTAKGSQGGEVNAELSLNDLNVADFDAIVFVGGPGALNYLDNQEAYRIARDAVKNNKILAAICISPAILAKAGVLKDKKATVWTSALNKEAQKVLEENGAIYQKDNVVRDGGIITGNGPEAAETFAITVIDALK